MQAWVCSTSLRVTACDVGLDRCPLLSGASAAAMLIFILPSAFYLKLVKKEPMKSVQKIGVRSRALGTQSDVALDLLNS